MVRNWPKSAISYVALLAVFPLALLAVNDTWILATPAAPSDSYVYAGYFQDLKDYLNDFGATYYGSRLPWLLLGNASYTVFSQETANLFLRMVLLYSGIFCLFITALKLWRNLFAATASAILLGAHTEFLTAISWNYVNGPVIVLVLAAMMLVVVAADAKYWRPLLILAGFALATACGIHIFTVFLVPFPIGWYLFQNWSKPRNSIVWGIIFIGIGAALSVGLFSVINWLLTQRLLYFWPQISSALREDLFTPWNLPLNVWLSTAGWLVFPGLVLVSSLPLLPHLTWRWRVHDIPSFEHSTILALVQLCFATALFLFLHLGASMNVFQYDEYTSYLMPFVFLALAAILATLGRQLDPRWQLGLTLFTAVVILLPLWLDVFRFLPQCGGCSVSWQTVILALATASLLVVSFFWRSLIPTLAALLILANLNVRVSDPALFPIPGEGLYTSSQLIYDTNAGLARFNDANDLWFWYDLQDENGRIFRSVSAMHLYFYRLVSEDLPTQGEAATNRRSYGANNVLPPTKAPLRPGQNIAILSSSDEALDVARVNARNEDMELDVAERLTFARGGKAFYATIVRVLPADSHLETTLSLTGFNAAPDATVNHDAQGTVTIRTVPKAYYYAATLDLPEPGTDISERSAYVRLRVTASDAPAAVGILKADRQTFLDRVPIAPGGTYEIFLKVPRLEDAMYLVAQTWTQGKSARLEIEEAAIYVFNK